MRSRIVLASLLCALTWSSNLVAQTTTTGSLTGSVRDQSGALIPGVEVKAEQEGTGLARSTLSTETGVYALAALPPGRYSVTFALSGFRTVINREISVNATERVTLNATLQIADVGTTIEVSASAELVQAETTTLGRVIDQRLTTDLPLPTKNYTQLLALSTGTASNVADTADLGRGSQDISANGARTGSNTFLLDGVDANNIHTNSARNNTVGSNGVPVPSTEMIREFKVQTGQYDAQYGRNGGASINVVTRSGSNDLHLVLYHYFRNDVLNANSFFFNRTGTSRPVLRQNQYGGTLGGPIFKNKTFFFVGFQGTRQVNGASSTASTTSLALPNIPEVRNRATLGQIFGGQAGRQGGVAITADGANINPVALALLNAKLPDGSYIIPSPQRPGAGTNYSLSVPARFEEEQITVNIDHDFTPNHKTSFKIFGANVPQTVPFTANLSVPGFPLFQDFKNRNASITYTSTITPRLVNEARLGYSRPAGSSNIANPVTVQQIGLNRFNSDKYTEIPQITVSGVFAMGYGASSDQKTIPNTFTYQDILSWTKGSHFIRAGFEARRYQTNLFNNAFFRGSLTFTTFADFLLGMPGGPQGNGTAFSNINASSVSAGQVTRHFRASDIAFYYQDDWKIAPQLNLNLGLRYEYLGAQYDKFGRTGNFDPRQFTPPPPGGQTSTGFVMPENSIFNVPGLKRVSNTFLDSNDLNNWAPRLGLAYRPFTNKPTVVRAGYGVFYERISNNAILQQLSALPFFSFFSTSGAAISFASFQNPFPVLPPNEAHPVVPVIYGTPNNIDRPLRSVFALDPQSRTPYMQHYSLNLQHELIPNVLWEIGYVGSKGTKLPFQRIINQAVLASPSNPINGVTTNTAANAAQRVPYIGFSPTDLRQQQTGTDSQYNSLQTSITKRFSHGLQFLTSYTWAKSLDNISGPGPNSTPSGDQNDLRQNRGLSDFDRTHRVVVSYLYEIPSWGFGLNDTAFGGRFFSGWQLTGVVAMQGGSPFNITDSTGGQLYGSNVSRANWAAGATAETAKLSGATGGRLDRYFNTSAFALSGLEFGNVGRNVLRGPGQRNMDIAIYKTTAIGERTKVQFRAEIFNLTNTAAFDNPQGNRASGAFGTISRTVNNARLIQFGLKLEY